MRKIVLSISICLVVFAASGQQFNFDNESIKSRLVEDLTVLAHDSLLGREAGTLYEQKAIDYIIQKYKEIGLVEHPNFKGYLQTIPMNRKFKVESTGFTIADTNFEYGDYYITAYSASAGAVGKAKCFTDAELKKLEQNSAPNNLEGIVAIVEIVGTDGVSDYQAISEAVEWKIKTCQRMGAEAVVFVKNGNGYYNLFNWGGASKMDIPVFVFRKKYYDLIKSFSGRNVELSAKLKRNDKTAYNVIGYIDNKAKYTVVIGGHYDHLGMGKFGSRYNGGNAIHNGADDNASGTVAVIELARFIKSKGLKNYNYMFIAFGAEEKGLIGSKYFCNSGEYDMSKVNYMINFDMVGRMRKLRDKCIVLGVKTSPELKKTIRSTKYKKGRLTKLKNGMDASDHAYFFKKDVPFIYFTTGLHSDYHTPTDDVETINFKGMVKIAKYVNEVVVKMDEKPKTEFSDPGNISMISLVSMFLP